MNVIDIGSNSVRLLSNGKKSVITTRLAQNMTNGNLHPHSIARTVDAIKTFCQSVNGECKIFATEAVRKAKNKDVFLHEVFSITGLEVDVLSGDQEAEVSYKGATDGISASAIVIDLGGASCEIIHGQNGKISYKSSSPFGCVTLCDQFGSRYNEIIEHINKTLTHLPPLTAENFIAVGGTATSLAAMAQELEIYDPNKVHGYTLSTSDIHKLINEVDDGKCFATLSPERRKTISQGGVALSTVLNRLGVNYITVSEKDNLEGYLLSL